MECTYSLKSNKKVVDIPATARLLKKLRLEHGYSVVQLQKMMELESAVSIYAWESEKIKNIPSIENFDFLAKLYGVHVEDLYVLKPVTDFGEMEVHEYTPDYGINYDLIMEDLDESEREAFCKVLNVTKAQRIFYETNNSCC